MLTSWNEGWAWEMSSLNKCEYILVKNDVLMSNLDRKLIVFCFFLPSNWECKKAYELVLNHAIICHPTVHMQPPTTLNVVSPSAFITADRKPKSTHPFGYWELLLSWISYWLSTNWINVNPTCKIVNPECWDAIWQEILLGFQRGSPIFLDQEWMCQFDMESEIQNADCIRSQFSLEEHSW